MIKNSYILIVMDFLPFYTFSTSLIVADLLRNKVNNCESNVASKNLWFRAKITGIYISLMSRERNHEHYTNQSLLFLFQVSRMFCTDTGETGWARRESHGSLAPLVEIVPKVHIFAMIRSHRRSSAVYADCRTFVSNCYIVGRIPRGILTL